MVPLEICPLMSSIDSLVLYVWAWGDVVRRCRGYVQKEEFGEVSRAFLTLPRKLRTRPDKRVNDCEFIFDERKMVWHETDDSPFAGLN